MPPKSTQIHPSGQRDFENSSTKGVTTVADTSSFAMLFTERKNCISLMTTVGTIGSIGSGASLAGFCILFGMLIDRLNGDHQEYEVNQVIVYLIVLAVVCAVLKCCQSIGWTSSGERKALLFRGKYIRSLLSHEIGWSVTFVFVLILSKF